MTVPAATAMPLKITKHSDYGEGIELNYQLVERFLVEFLRDEVTRVKGFSKVVIGLSGGVDSAVVAALAIKAFGAANVLCIRMPHAQSNPNSLSDAAIVAEQLGLTLETIDITEAVDGYCKLIPDISARRKGNVMARVRMIIAFDKAEQYHALHLGTGNKTERLFGYYTWHDIADTGPVSPLGDLLKTQIWGLARHLQLPSVVIDKAPSADLEVGQTDESDLGISYRKADIILHHYLKAYPDDYIEALGFSPQEIQLVKNKVNSTHWKRAMPIHAMVSGTAIAEFYLRPVDFRL
jgi:NAD+ synthase